MNKIEIYRTHIVVNDYELGSCQLLENCFKIYDPERYTTYYEGLHYIE